jgi:hypothetical protein
MHPTCCIFRWNRQCGDPRLTDDIEVERAEEQRKADMMERWYIKQRMLGRDWPNPKLLSDIFTLEWWHRRMAKESQ